MRFSAARLVVEDGRMSPIPSIGSEASVRALCAGCLGSFPRQALASVGDSSLCESCSARTAPHVAGELAAPIGAAIHQPAETESGLLADMRAWCGRASWIPRLPLLLLLGWWALNYARDVTYRPIIAGLNFGIHEFGHVLFGPLGMFLAIAGGTITQCLAPVIAGVMFLRQRDYFAVAFAIGWLATNCFDVAVYLADATAQVLPLLGLGSGEPIHDWNWLLRRSGLLGSEATLATLLRVVGGTLFALAIGLGSWLLVQMGIGRRDRARR